MVWENTVHHSYICAYLGGGTANTTGVQCIFPSQPATEVGVSHLNTSLYQSGAAPGSGTTSETVRKTQPTLKRPFCPPSQWVMQIAGTQYDKEEWTKVGTQDED